MDQKKIGEFLKSLRNEKGITQEQAAEKFGVSQRTVSRWETGSNMPDISMLIELAEFYDVDVREIIDGERKSENMKEEVKETLEKVSDYNDKLNAEAAKRGIISNIMLVILTVIAIFKGVTPSPFVCIICAFNAASFLTKYKNGNDGVYFATGILFVIALFMNALDFIVS